MSSGEETKERVLEPRRPHDLPRRLFEQTMRTIAQRVALHLLQAYKRFLSPMFAPACRYVPTCSEYAMEAIDRFGVLHGGAMALWRLLRCHPFAHGGYDPVVKAESDPCKTDISWKSGDSAPRPSAQFLPGFSPLKRNS